jgi:protein-S-isoprenylcysteine O-methyltransferase Ste14
MIAVVLAGALTGHQWHSAILFGMGWILFGIGGLIGIWGKINLGANRTPMPQPKATGIFVEHGIYRQIRHPLYSSLLFASLGWALIWSSYVALVTAVVLIVFLNAKATCEERWMRQRFPEYAAYAARVKKLIPFVY